MNEHPHDSDNVSVVLTAIYMAIYYTIYLLLGYVLLALGVVQLVVKLLSGKPHAGLALFGASLSRYMAQIVEYIAMRSPRRPFPFNDWPQVDEEERG